VDTITPHFAADSAVQPLGDGRYAAFVTPSWSAPVGPNGGYIAAIVVRAIEAQVADPQRSLRSLTLHYLRSPLVDTAAEVVVQVERSGRSFTSVSARMTQGDRLCVLAVAALAQPLPTAADYVTSSPQVPAPGEIAPIPVGESVPEITRRFDFRHALGAPPCSGGDEALTGGWIRLHEPCPVDAALLALIVDAWLPSPWSRLEQFAPAPTVDLTIHFRAPAVARALAPDSPFLVRFRSTTSYDGLFEEDGEVWAPDGTLLAQGRQLALLRPPRQEQAP